MAITVPTTGQQITAAWGKSVADELNTRGVVAFRQGTASLFTVSVSAATDITVTAGQPPSIAALALSTARRYRMSFLCNVSIGTANARGVFDLYADGVIVATYAFSRNYAAGALDEFWHVFFVPPDSLPHTWKVTARSADAPAVLGFGAVGPTHPLQFTIEDVGAAL